MVHRLYGRHYILRIFHMAIWRKFHYTISSTDNSDCLWMENALSMEYKQTKNRILPQKYPKVKFVNILLFSGCFFIKQKIYLTIFTIFSTKNERDLLPASHSRTPFSSPFCPPLQRRRYPLFEFMYPLFFKGGGIL